MAVLGCKCTFDSITHLYIIFKHIFMSSVCLYFNRETYEIFQKIRYMKIYDFLSQQCLPG